MNPQPQPLSDPSGQGSAAMDGDVGSVVLSPSSGALSNPTSPQLVASTTGPPTATTITGPSRTSNDVVSGSGRPISTPQDSAALAPSAASSSSDNRAQTRQRAVDGSLALIMNAAAVTVPQPTAQIVAVPSAAIEFLLSSPSLMAALAEQTQVQVLSDIQELASQAMMGASHGYINIRLHGLLISIEHFMQACLFIASKLTGPNIGLENEGHRQLLASDLMPSSARELDAASVPSGVTTTVLDPVPTRVGHTQSSSRPRSAPSSPAVSASVVQASLKPGQNAHVFVDNSNIFIGAQLENMVRNLAKRVNIRELCRLIEGGMPCAYRAVAGAAQSSSKIWKEWENNGYEVFLSPREYGDRGGDDALHLAIARVLEDPVLAGRPQVLVLATGDGNETASMQSFPRLAERAVELGWDVQVWSWQQSLSGKFKELAARHPNSVKILFLDSFKDQLTFRAGSAPDPMARPKPYEHAGAAHHAAMQAVPEWAIPQHLPPYAQGLPGPYGQGVWSWDHTTGMGAQPPSAYMVGHPAHAHPHPPHPHGPPQHRQRHQAAHRHRVPRQYQQPFASTAPAHLSGPGQAADVGRLSQQVESSTRDVDPISPTSPFAENLAKDLGNALQHLDSKFSSGSTVAITTGETASDTTGASLSDNTIVEATTTS